MPEMDMDTHDDPDLAPVTDRDEWELDPSPLDVRPRPGAAISLRLDPEDARLVRTAARAAGISQSEFIRAAARATEILAAHPAHVCIRTGDSAVISYVDDAWVHRTATTGSTIEPGTAPRRIDWADDHDHDQATSDDRGRRDRTPQLSLIGVLEPDGTLLRTTPQHHVEG